VRVRVNAASPHGSSVFDLTRLVTDHARSFSLACASIQLFSLGVAPSLRGAAVGISRLTDIALLVADVASQLTGYLIVTLLVMSLITVFRARGPAWLKANATVATAFTILGILFAGSLDIAPSWLSGTLALLAGSVGVAIGIEAILAKEHRDDAIVIGLVGASALLRGIVCFSGEGTLARILWIAGCALSAFAIAAFVGFAVLRKARVAPIALTAVAALIALCGASSGETESAALHVIRQSALRIAGNSIVVLPVFVACFIALAGPLLSFVRRANAHDRRLDAIGLVLVAAASPHRPLLAGCFLAGAMLMSVALRDPRGTHAVLRHAETRRAA
jgi:hypothetical protein